MQNWRRLWRITVEPDGNGDVTVALPATADCAAANAVCTGDGRPLSNAVTVTVFGPPGLSVADARANENTDETVDFAVTLRRPRMVLLWRLPSQHSTVSPDLPQACAQPVGASRPSAVSRTASSSARKGGRSSAERRATKPER